MTIQSFIQSALLEDVGNGDHSTLASIPADARGKAVLKIKEDGLIAGLDLAKEIFAFIEPGSVFTFFKKDGDKLVAKSITSGQAAGNDSAESKGKGKGEMCK